MERRRSRHSRPLHLSTRLVLSMGFGALVGVCMPEGFCRVLVITAQALEALLWIALPLAAALWLVALSAHRPSLAQQVTRFLTQAVLPLLPLPLCGLFTRLTGPVGAPQLWPSILTVTAAVLLAEALCRKTPAPASPIPSPTPPRPPAPARWGRGG